MNMQETITERNNIWGNLTIIPKWVDLESVGLDQFFTNEILASQYIASMYDFLNNRGISIDECLFIEPSAGDGAFLKHLPIKNSIGLDILPLHPKVKKADFLSWTPPQTKKYTIFIGNPPFGYRAWLALSFMNHAAQFADYIFFILPMAFQSDGKGSPKHRVKNMRLVSSEIVPNNSFEEPDGTLCKINALWQIWERGENTKEDLSICKNYIEIFTVDQRKERLCGQEKMLIADYFLQRTYFNTKPELVKQFSKVKYVCGYGLIIKRERKRIVSILQNTDWDEYSNLAAHNCRHISMYHIKKALVEGGIAQYAFS